MIRSYLHGLAGQAGAKNPAALAEQLYLLFEGAITASQLHREPWSADYGLQAAELLVAAARTANRSRPASRRKIIQSGRLR
jgi:hypothetical protein